MSTEEFSSQAVEIAGAIAALGTEADRIAAACRGSANPAALAWCAEGLRIDDNTLVVDLGAGLGGPAAWLTARYRCRVIAVEPAMASATAVADLFSIPVIVGSAMAAPLRSSLADVVLLLGVLSVVDDPYRALCEAHRLAPRVGVLDYCSTDGTTRRVGGSTFRTSEALTALVREAGWSVTETSPVTIAAPRPWREVDDSVDVDAVPSEQAVVAAIDAGLLAPFMVLAER
jgi:SAM-dependent methyltransferase